MPNKNINEHNKGTRFTSENQPKNRGRKKSKLKGMIEKNDLGADDINNMLSNLIDKDQDELQEIANDSKTPIIMRTFAGALLKDIKDERTGTLENMLDRWVGKATQKVEQTGDMELKISVDFGGEE